MALNLEALDELDRVARECPSDEHFDMGRVGCGSTHCLYGWARVDPWFTERASFPDRSMRSLLGITIDQFEILFGFSKVSYTSAKGLKVKAEVVANLGRLRRGEPLLGYTGSEWRKLHGDKPIPGTEGTP